MVFTYGIGHCYAFSFEIRQEFVTVVSDGAPNLLRSGMAGEVQVVGYADLPESVNFAKVWWHPKELIGIHGGAAEAILDHDLHG